MSIEQLFKTASLADTFDIPESSLINDRTTGRLGIKYIKIGRLVRYRYSDIKAYLDSCVRDPSITEGVS